MNIIILLHYDWDEYIHKNTPIHNIKQWAKHNDYKIIEVYHTQPMTEFEHIIDMDVCEWNEKWLDNKYWQSKYFNNDNIILAGGYKNQCLRWVYNHLKTSNKVSINPQWVVEEPSWIWWSHTNIENWKYPQEALLS